MRSLFKIPLVIWIFLTLVSYASVLVSPEFFKYSGLIAFSIPIFISVNIILTLISILFKWKLGWVSLILSIVAYPFYGVAFGLNKDSVQKKVDLTVLSFNVKWFSDARKDNYSEVIKWIDSVDADVLCFQEYYPSRDISKRISDQGKYYESMDKKTFHVAIYSKFPIIEDGLVFNDQPFNNIRFADLKVGLDTIRIYSAHLQSMGINPALIQDSEGIQSEYENVTNKFISGSQGRTLQLKALIKHANEVSFPKIIAGDFNDVPFSFNYFHLKEKFKNAFEERGSGFGATYNGKIPYLRIDHQFFSQGLEIFQFNTEQEIFFSDHYPIIGKYQISH